MHQKTIFLLLCFLGTLLPLTQFIPWILENGIDLSAFVNELFSTKIGAFFGIDVIVSAVALFVFIYFETSRLKIKNIWLPVVCTLFIGVSLGLPLFLYLRQIRLDKLKGTSK